MLEAIRLSALLKPLAATMNSVDTHFDSVSIDARGVQPGGLFVALAGSRVNGHDFVAQARDNGAAAAMVEYLVDDELPQLLVHDCQLALGQLAALVRESYQGQVIAITGSSGKTSVKEMLASILRQAGQVLATEGNLNNELGVPLTLLRLKAEHQFAVIEMGAAAVGDIAYTMTLAKPQISVLTNAEMAHVGRFGSPESIAKAKGEIVSELPDGGKAVLNLDSPWFEQWYQLLGSKRTACSFSLKNPTAQLRADNIQMDAKGCPAFELQTPAGAVSVQLQVRGQHNIANALAAAGAALAAGVSLDCISAGLSALPPVAGRGNSVAGIAGAQIIDDSYNANPASVKAAIDLLAGLQGTRILVLGDMGELGEWAESSHREVGEYAAEQGLDALYAVGTLSALAVQAFGEHGQLFASKQDLIEALKGRLDISTQVLVKGSRSAGMDEVVAGLAAAVDTQNNENRVN
ncbi:UDP-N-acetylmuramoyl-tripeptide--D-alanyl-D-alanine ligase [Halopseudomonas sabulinigri]|uniref:UDP-N-acetylmuramoyl-tripeptide--D-alanyl-D-alanine ligase n=1 Tax=Halopseudomonas sabulinigri TaxID=472181 RepID=A0ABP9ZNI5_9GAMM